MPELHLQFDPLADVLYVSFREVAPGGAPRSRVLDERRIVALDATGEPAGVEFLEASRGVDPSGVPAEREIRAALGALLKIPVLASA